MSQRYIDIGINLAHRQFQYDRDEVIERAKAVGVCAMIVTGTSVRASESAAALTLKHSGYLYSTAGVHPHDAKSCDDRTIGQLRKLLSQSQVVAVGECGLDYDRDFSPRDVQRRWFEAQLQLADELEMPLFLHERAAFSDFRAMLAAFPQLCSRAVVHCFTGSRAELEAYLELGCSIGITGWICDERRGTELRSIVKHIPIEKLMIETDAPFLLPRNLREKPRENRNEPVYLPHIANEIAFCRGDDPAEMAAKVWENTRRFFTLP